MPVWTQLESLDAVTEAEVFETRDYVVTSSPEMGRQLVHVCRPEGGAVHLSGLVEATVWCASRSY